MLKEEILSYVDRFSAYLAEVEGKPNTTIAAYTGDVRQMAVIFSEDSVIVDHRIADLRKPDANAYPLSKWHPPVVDSPAPVINTMASDLSKSSVS